ncbi:hypothetical protein M3Y96_00201200 [Aphelenchoides besseyi]|nr:hypothetical protein M3Y96_00201200 [Aphelenchoides besseyi]
MDEEKSKRPTRVEKLFSVCELRPYLFIAGYGALSERKFRELGITHAVDCTNLPKPLRIAQTEYMDVKGDDSEMFEINKYFVQTADFIKHAKEKITTICMVYLLIHENLTLEKAYYDVLSLLENVRQRYQLIERLEKTANEFAQRAEAKKSKSVQNHSAKIDVISAANTKHQSREPRLSKQQINRKILLDEYQNCGSPVTACFRLNRECGPHSMSYETIRKWFCRFDAGIYDLRNKRKQKQPETTQKDGQKSVEQNSEQSLNVEKTPKSETS